MENLNQNYYDSMVLRIEREHKPVYHARTGEHIIGCTSDDKPKVYHKKHLHGFPAVAYHSRINRTLKSGTFTVEPFSKGERQLLGITPTDTEALLTRVKGELHYKNTGQYKTVWNTRGQRRSKA